MSDPQFPGEAAGSSESPAPWAQPPQAPATPGWAQQAAAAAPASPDAATTPAAAGWEQQAPAAAPAAPDAASAQAAPGWAQPAAAPAWGQPAAPAQAPAAPAWGQPAGGPAPGASPAPQAGWTQPPAPAGQAGWPQPQAAPQWTQQPGYPQAGYGQQPGYPPAGYPQAGYGQQPSYGAPAPTGYNQGWGATGSYAAPVAQPGHFMLRGLIAGLFLLLMGLLTLLVATVFVTGGAILGGVMGDLLRQYGVTVDEFGGSGAQQTLDTAKNVVTGVLIFFGVLIGIFGLIETLGGFGTLLRRGWGRVLGFVAAIIAAPMLTFGMIGSFGALSSARDLGVDTANVGGNAGLVGLAIAIAVVVLYWFTLYALITGGAHFRRR